MRLSEPQQWTVWFCVAVVVLVLAFDGFMWATFGADATISRVFTALGRRYPAFPLAVVFLLGALVGHWWL